MTSLTIFVLVIIAALQIVRAIIGMDVIVGGLPIPALASWIAAAVALALAVGLWMERRRNRTRVDADTVTSAPTRSEAAPALAPAKSSPLRESVMVDGKLVPAAYFMFASKVLSIDAIKKAKQKYGRVLVGFDAGYIPRTGQVSGEAFQVARDLGAELEVYVEGPGGATGTSGWDPGEAARVKAAAEEIGIDTGAKDWRKRQWDTGGWKTFTFRQLEDYAKQGFNAAEIDNIERVVKGSGALIALYQDYAALQTAGRLPQLVMKNVSEEDMRVVVEAVEIGGLPRTMFSEFHIFECGKTNEWHPLDLISKRIGIRTVPSRDTYNYAAKGEFGLQQEFDTALGLSEPRVTSSAAVS